MGRAEGLTFVTPTLAYGPGCPDTKHYHYREAGYAWRYLKQPDADHMVVVADEAAAREVLAGLGLDPALIEDRIHFGKTGEVAAV